MDVVVKGMEMPTGCYIERGRCPLNTGLKCKQTDRVCPQRIGERPDWCPLIEVKEGEEGIYGIVY